MTDAKYRRLAELVRDYETVRRLHREIELVSVPSYTAAVQFYDSDHRAQTVLTQDMSAETNAAIKNLCLADMRRRIGLLESKIEPLVDEGEILKMNGEERP